MTGPGIDYGMGTSNRDTENGIRYGVISQHSVLQAWADSAEPDYGVASCPKCGGTACEFSVFEADEDTEYSHGCSDYACETCNYVFDSMEAYSEEAQGWNFNDDGYELTDCLDSDIFVLKSPYYTFADFCSPCVPGAGNLNSDNPDGVQTYCLGHDWFDDGRAPYPVYSVETNQLIEPATA